MHLVSLLYVVVVNFLDLVYLYFRHLLWTISIIFVTFFGLISQFFADVALSYVYKPLFYATDATGRLDILSRS
jgi:hypothetical protein